MNINYKPFVSLLYTVDATDKKQTLAILNCLSSLCNQNINAFSALAKYIFSTKDEFNWMDVLQMVPQTKRIIPLKLEILMSKWVLAMGKGSGLHTNSH